MIDIELLDDYYQNFIKNISDYLPEGFSEVDLKVLQKYKLLNFNDIEISPSALTGYFHLIETEEKLTLINERYFIWLIPEASGSYSSTYALIALNKGEKPHFETGFKASGVYNCSHMILSVLEKMLEEIQENEDLINSLK